MAERDVPAARNGVPALFHERQEALEIMRPFCQCFVYIEAEPVAVGELFNVTLPAVVARAVRLGIFNDGHSMLYADQVAQSPDGGCAAPEVSEFSPAVQTGGIPINVIMDMALVRVGADNKGMIAL